MTVGAVAPGPTPSRKPQRPPPPDRNRAETSAMPNRVQRSAIPPKTTLVNRTGYTRNAATGLLRHAAKTAFYVANAPLTATRAAQAVRAHWQIETTSHHSRNVTLGEDRSRTRTNPGVFARLRSFAFNILKANRTRTLSQDHYRAALAGINNLLSLVTSQ